MTRPKCAFGLLRGYFVRGVGSSRRPTCNPPCGVAQGDLLIPVISSEVGVDGGAEQKEGNGSGTSMSGR